MYVRAWVGPRPVNSRVTRTTRFEIALLMLGRDASGRSVTVG